ncbi:MAG: ABC transporter substrate-binding protein [Rhodovibrionaceae bacterium]|nr:ABC transporter substrate-binding protein [Rhodovibrionaceae bacterium]
MTHLQNQAIRPPLAELWRVSSRMLGLAAAIAIAVSLTLARPAASASTAEQAEAFLTNLSQKAVEGLKGEEMTQEEREQRFRQLLDHAFDMEAISQFVLGRYSRVASEEEKQRFTDVLKDIVVQRFMPLFGDYRGEGLDVRQTVVDEGRNLVTIITSTEFQGEPVRLDWRLRPRGESFKIVDVVVEGASLVITYRSEYAAFIKQNGGNVSALIADLREKLDRGAFKPENTTAASKS